MNVGTLAELLEQFDPRLPVVVMLPDYGKAIPVEVVQVQGARYLDEEFMSVSDVVLLRAVGTVKDDDA